MRSQVAITVSGHVFAYPTVMSIGARGTLQPQAPSTAAQDAPRLGAETRRQPLWAVEFATTA
jgi:hypothetical protein